eukprot:CAMPEP_0114621812 /NCGR_PEP_ID=MMETSP0168-20121206/9418_1 /TAXON_ID=95228 ORGANISM="Vannella sp., Strain DIVA3 517/6/12" /NCGR_SAMPLE_ID=MMETSP0168 /ASSEMBLY_ACC=CAM_ASM_000044 /LENGTH=721 /DNA_ID=CAMNT_0001833015 /DNA_START=11 /DNA_END=2176 /DNA_ORIENTATION=-
MTPGGNTTPLEGAVSAVNLFVQQKMLFKPKDEVGVVLFGTEETDNPLQDHGYENISVLRDIGTPDLDLLRDVEAIGPSKESGDFIDALIVGMDMLINHPNKAKKPINRIYLVTNAAGEVNKDELKVVLQQFKKLETALFVFGVDFDRLTEEEEDLLENGGQLSVKQKMRPNKSKQKLENEMLLYKMAVDVGGRVLPVKDAVETMSLFRSRAVMPTSLFSGYFEISPHLKVKVKSHTKCRTAAFPTMKKISRVAQEAAEPGTTTVSMERSYHPINELEKELEKDDLEKGYKYGKSLIPFSNIDVDVLKYTADRCLVLVGMTSEELVPRHHYMANTEAVVADAADPQAGVAISALVRAMKETKSVAIVRYAKRKDSVQLGVLTPQVKDDQEFFYYHKLPFAEDIRQYQFPPLDPTRAKQSAVPSPEQVQAAENLINALDLSVAGEDEYGDTTEVLKPKHTYNPVLQHFYQTVQARALKPGAPVPKLDPRIEAYVNPDEALLAKAKVELDAFEAAFPLQRVEAQEKTQRRYWSDAVATTGDISLDSYVQDSAAKKRKVGEEGETISVAAIVAGGTSDVGPIHPVKDFEAMLARRDVDLVDKAVEQMQERISQLVADSIRDQLYAKAVDCLKALRSGCVQEEEADAFNAFLRKLRASHEGKRRDAFWQLVVEAGVTLIHDEECEDSPVPKAEALEFLTAPSQEAEDEPMEEAGTDEVDDLFDMVE